MAEQDRPGKATPGVRYTVDVWEETTSYLPTPWRWRVTKVSLDKDGNPSGPWKDVASGAEQTRERAQQAAAKSITYETNP